MSNDNEKNLDYKKKDGCYSHAEKHSIIYTWKIDEIISFFKSARKTRELVSIYSENFSTGARCNDLWYLELTIDKDDETSESKSWAAIYLVPAEDCPKIRSECKMFVLNNKNEKVKNELEIHNKLSTEWLDHVSVNTLGHSYQMFIKIDELLNKKDEFLPNCTLTVSIELTVYDNYLAIKNPINPLKTDSKGKLGDDFRDLFDAKKQCDVTIAVGDKKFNVHKFLLIARSCVFEAMLAHHVKKNEPDEITVHNVDPKIFEKLLEFIYTDQVNDLDNFAEELLEMSYIYQLKGLKEICEDSLSNNLSVGNTVRILILADRYNAERLKEFAMNYITINWNIFKNIEEYKALEETKPSLFLAVLKKYIDKTENN